MTAIKAFPRRRAELALVLALLLCGSLLGGPRAAAAEEEIRIVRDKLGVPHVFAKTAAGASYGAGYALAQDRLWLMHFLRRTAKGELSDILGTLVVEMDKEVNFFTYTEEERAARFATYPKDIRDNFQAFADGVNAWIEEIRSDPSLLPLEFNEFGEGIPEDWAVDDSLALADYLILSFGAGGGNEIAHADLLAGLLEEHGKRKGLKMFNDLVLTEDPDSPMTIPRDYAYSRKATLARNAVVEPRRRLENDARLSLTQTTSATVPGPHPAAAKGTLAQLRLIPDMDVALKALERLRSGLLALRHVRFGSNAQIVGPQMSEHRNSLQTAGPQVGYFVPQVLADIGIHGGNLDATGMTFPGAGPAVLIGRGDGYAWTTTTGSSDLTDTYVEKLNPDDARQYRYKGRWEDMECRTETYSVHGAPIDEQEICRTRHGPVLAFDEANNVAYSVRMAWFNREGQTVEGFFRYNEVKNVGDFATYASYLASNHNMFYVDDRGNYGYWHPGNHPVRAKGVDIRLPQDGTGRSEWRGLVPLRKVPHAVNFKQGWLSNWNNQPAVGWKRERAWSLIDNSADIQDALDPRGPTLSDPLGGKVNPDGKLDYEDLNANLRYAAFKHHPHSFFKRFLPKAKWLKEEPGKGALEVVRAWDGFLTDRDGDGMYDSAGNAIVDRWIAAMRSAAFDDDLGTVTDQAGASLLWHVLASDDRVKTRFDWLGKSSAKDLRIASWQTATAQLAEANGGEPGSWNEPIRLEHFTRINSDLVGDNAETEGGQDNSGDSGRPGDIPDQIEMDRGTFNHIVVYLDPARKSGPLGRSDVQAGSVIPPGQSGFIDPMGQESVHYRDQLAYYLEWRYKPMPMTLKEALAEMESDITIVKPG